MSTETRSQQERTRQGWKAILPPFAAFFLILAAIIAAGYALTTI